MKTEITVRFLYTSLSTIKKAVTKTGYPKAGVNHYIVTSGNNYTDCLIKAKNECKFNDNQLLGSRFI